MTRMRMSVQVAGLLGAALALGVGWAGPAQAHTDLAASSPADGARLDAAPGRVVLDFTEAPAPGRSTVTLSVDGAPAQRLDLARGERATALLATVPDGAAPAGTTTRWRVAYEVVARDGHTVDGDLAFTVTTPEAPTEPAAPSVPAAETTAPGEVVVPATPDGGTGADPAAAADPVPVEPGLPAVVWLAGAAALGLVLWLAWVGTTRVRRGAAPR